MRPAAFFFILLECLGVHRPAWMISDPHGGGIINLPTFMLVVMFAQTRMFLVMARKGCCPTRSAGWMQSGTSRYA